jgi:hypothetical protein
MPHKDTDERIVNREFIILGLSNARRRTSRVNRTGATIGLTIGYRSNDLFATVVRGIGK